MIQEDYVSFEVAKLLKEKGFDEVTLNSYRANGQLRGEYKHCNIPCPTHQTAMKWLREDKHIFIEIKKSSNTFLYGASIMKDCSRYYSRILNAYNTYEEIVEAALKYCLENLI